MESPCTKVCVLDPVTGLCIGCGRTGAEIGHWLGLSVEQRKTIMASLPERLQSMTSRATRSAATQQRR